ADNLALAQKAAAQGFSATGRLLSNYNITRGQLAAALEAPLEAIDELLAGPSHAPLLMIDGEDAIAAGAQESARQNTAALLQGGQWRGSLRFFRPGGIPLPTAVDDIISVVKAAQTPAGFLLDGLIFPKLENEAEAQWLHELLTRLEDALTLPPHQIKVNALIESAGGVEHVLAIAQTLHPRLSGLIFGTADYAASVGLPEISYTHPLCDWARGRIINTAGLLDVPAIDAMTLNYPVAILGYTAAQNRTHLLGRLKECYDDCWHSIRWGMKGKLVGHPLQLFVTLLAFHVHHRQTDWAAKLNELRLYHQSLHDGKGVIALEGAMIDRATDVQARRRLREGVALGYVDGHEAAALGVITAAELAMISK
ncbi:MAG: hypothetical protein KDE51_13820, partial [Anaerolineales bacterium]|nr:hypothetical protein [Anaerolineales bacterium]